MSGKRIGTHDGKFHCDEVLGCFMLKQLPEYKDAKIVRSRDPEVLKECDIVIDVGAEYSHEEKRYDHHQKEFTENLQSLTGINHRIRLSSAGLVYAHYGKEVIKAMTKKSLKEEELHLVYCQVYSHIIKEVDAKDNGIETCFHNPMYRIYTDLSSRVAKLNPNSFSQNLTEEGQFQVAYELVGKEFIECVDNFVNQWLPSRIYVSEALDNRLDVDSSGQIVELPLTGLPWATHLKVLEAEKGIDPEILFVIFPDSMNGWRVQAVPMDDGFELRRKVLSKCTGLRNEVLVEECKVSDALFVHHTGFIGGSSSREGAIKMAQLSLP